MNRRVLLALLICAALVALSCGKKSAPRIVMPKKPGTPINITAIRRPGGIALAWERRSSAESYEVSRLARDGSVVTSSTEKPGFMDTATDDSKDYIFTVVSISDEGIFSDYSAPLDIGPLPALAAPAPFTSAITGDGVRLTWGDADTVNIYRELVNTPYDTDPYAERIQNSPYDDRPDPKAAVKYSARAAGYALLNAVRFEGPASNDAIVTPTDYLPSGTKGIKAFRKEDEVVVMWDENPERWVTGYEVLREGEGGEFGVIATVWPPAFTDSNPPRGETAYKVRAVGPGIAGPASDAVRVGPAEPK